MKRISSVLLASCCSLLTAFAQTALSAYQPGVTAEGAVYFLPKTAIRVVVQVEKTTYTPGDFCRYSERFLRIKDVPSEPSVSYRIVSLQQEAVAVADTSKCYAVKFDSKTCAANVALSDDGVLLSINAAPPKQAAPSDPASRFASSERLLPNPRQYMSEEILAAGSTAKMAELTALDIYEIRESRNLLVRGQADNMPKDGAQLKLMLSQLDEQDRALSSLFTGVTVRDTVEKVFTIVPNGEIKRDVLFRFSQKLGIVDADDLGGTPYYITVENLRAIPQPEVDAKKKARQVSGIYVNIPGRLKSVVSTAAQALVASEFPAGQFGNVELLSAALFNKRYTTHLWLHPLSGAVERLEAEQPK